MMTSQSIMQKIENAASYAARTTNAMEDVYQNPSNNMFYLHALDCLEYDLTLEDLYEILEKDIFVYYKTRFHIRYSSEFYTLFLSWEVIALMIELKLIGSVK